MERRSNSLKTDTPYQSTRATERAAPFHPQLTQQCILSNLCSKCPHCWAFEAYGPLADAIAHAREARAIHGQRALDPESRQPARVPRLAHLRLLKPSHLQLYLKLGFAAVATTVVVPTPTALTPHAHAHAPPTPTTTPATPGSRHPQLRACVHVPGCKD